MSSIAPDRCSYSCPVDANASLLVYSHTIENNSASSVSLPAIAATAALYSRAVLRHISFVYVSSPNQFSKITVGSRRAVQSSVSHFLTRPVCQARHIIAVRQWKATPPFLSECNIPRPLSRPKFHCLRSVAVVPARSRSSIGSPMLEQKALSTAALVCELHDESCGLPCSTQSRCLNVASTSSNQARFPHMNKQHK